MNREPKYQPDALPEAWRELYEERAAIMEFDGGMVRADAERFAMLDIEDQIAKRRERRTAGARAGA